VRELGEELLGVSQCVETDTRRNREFAQGSVCFVKHVVEGRQTCYENGRFGTVSWSTSMEVKS
jgi:hypothetical protein